MQLLTLGLEPHDRAARSARAGGVRRRRGLLDDRPLARALTHRPADAVSEAAIVSTCNRTELYCAVDEPDIAQQALHQFVATERQLDLDELHRHSYVLPHVNAVRHAFRVASGLDSMVLGEPQILGQMKEAEKLARNAGGLGLMLNHLFQRTFAVAKEVRSTTEIGTQSVSMAAAAVRVARTIFGELGGEPRVVRRRRRDDRTDRHSLCRATSQVDHRGKSHARARRSARRAAAWKTDEAR